MEITHQVGVMAMPNDHNPFLSEQKYKAMKKEVQAYQAAWWANPGRMCEQTDFNTPMHLPIQLQKKLWADLMMHLTEVGDEKDNGWKVGCFGSRFIDMADNIRWAFYSKRFYDGGEWKSNKPYAFFCLYEAPN